MDKTLLDVLNDAQPKSNSQLTLALLRASEESNQQKDKHIAVLNQDLKEYHKDFTKLQKFFEIRKSSTTDEYYIVFIKSEYSYEIICWSQSNAEVFEEMKNLLHLDFPNEDD